MHDEEVFVFLPTAVISSQLWFFWCHLIVTKPAETKKPLHSRVFAKTSVLYWEVAIAIITQLSSQHFSSLIEAFLIDWCAQNGVNVSVRYFTKIHVVRFRGRLRVCATFFFFCRANARQKTGIRRFARPISKHLGTSLIRLQKSSEILAVRAIDNSSIQNIISGMTAFKIDQLVVLKGLANKKYNGELGLVRSPLIDGRHVIKVINSFTAADCHDVRIKIAPCLRKLPKGSQTILCQMSNGCVLQHAMPKERLRVSQEAVWGISMPSGAVKLWKDYTQECRDVSRHDCSVMCCRKQ